MSLRVNLKLSVCRPCAAVHRLPAIADPCAEPESNFSTWTDKNIIRISFFPQHTTTCCDDSLFSNAAPDNSDNLRHVITGVALAAAVDDREVALYFGCAAQISGGLGRRRAGPAVWSGWSSRRLHAGVVDSSVFSGGLGGLGLLRRPAYDVWPATIRALRYDSDCIYAAASEPSTVTCTVA